MKKRILMGIGLILFIIGMFFLGYSLEGKLETNKAQGILYDRFINHKSNSNLNSNVKQEENNDSLINGPDEMDYLNKVTPMAIIEIPKIDLKAIVADGVEDNILKYAVGHFPNTSFPGKEGNFAVAGHRNFRTGEFFLNLHKLLAGDDIIITTHENKYVYKVTETFVVGPENTYILNHTNTSTITLVTCTTDGKDRLIVRGELSN